MQPRSNLGVPAPWQRAATACCLAAVLMLGTGCADLFSPSFVETFFPDGDGASAFSTVDPPIGHIAILFENNARIADDVFTYLIQGGAVVPEEVVDEILRVNPQANAAEVVIILQSIIDGLPTNLEELNLPPFVRMVVQVQNTDGGIQRLEFVEGLRLARGEDQVAGTDNTAQLPPDLQEDTDDLYIVQCDIASIAITSIQVFIPVITRLLENETNDEGEVVEVICVSFQPPRFEALEPDAGFDPNAEIYTQLRNYDPRNFPTPLINVSCGGVVILDLGGTLTLPYREIPDNCLPTVNPPDDGRAPAYFVDNVFDLIESETIPGRYEVAIRLRDQ